MEVFRIEIAEGQQGRFFDIRPLGNNRYDIFIEEDQLGTITLNDEGQAVGEGINAELDQSLLKLIGEQIRFHEQVHPRG